MENLKIRVYTEQQAKAAIELAEKLGYKEAFPKSFNLIDGYVCLGDDKDILKVCIAQAGSELNEYKYISMADLSLMAAPQHKEYLDPHNNYELIEWDGGFMVQDHWIAVPDGAESLLSFNNGLALVFYKQNLNYVVGDDEDWNKLGVYYEYLKSRCPHVVTVWQRHTQPEELPFIDVTNADTDSANELFASNSLESTLAERQASYGDFEDVAYATESLVDVLKKANYDKMTKEQKMALYMICSKMARLVNGNPAHKDSWHDIAGYSKLVEDSL